MNIENYPQTWIAHDRKIRAYQWSHRILNWLGLAIKIGVLYWLAKNHNGKMLQMMVFYGTSHLFLVWLGFFAAFGLALWLLCLPLSIAGHWVERKFGLSKQSYGKWFIDQFKGIGVGVVLGTIMLGLLFLSQLWSPDSWWLIAATFMLLFSVLMAQLAPVILVPLFFPLKPMPESGLKQRLMDLCRRFEVDVKEVYHLGMGDKTEKGNAAFMGLGKTKRIMIGDTLYEKYSEEEVEAVFAHELGHQVHNDLWKGIGISTVFLYLGFGIAFYLTRDYVGPYFDARMTLPFGLLLFFVVLSIVQTPMGWVQAAWSRYRERLADQFASETVGVPVPLADALEKLTFQNWGQFRPNALKEWLTYSHPAPWRRIFHLRGVKV